MYVYTFAYIPGKVCMFFQVFLGVMQTMDAVRREGGYEGRRLGGKNLIDHVCISWEGMTDNCPWDDHDKKSF